jgi:glycerol-3-phosphate dehydrogenase
MERLPLPTLSRDSYDVIVIGAGVNGAAASQELAARGFRVLIVDKGDFSSGATGRSSRILHCGLRYLAPGKSAWDYVKHPGRFLLACRNAGKSMKSRSQIVGTQSSLVRPFKFSMPIYEDGPYAPWQVDVAFKLLEMLGPRDLPLDYRRYSGQSMDDVPFSKWVRDQNRLKGFAVFRDYQFLSAERMVVDTLKDADRMGATVRNYTECLSAKREGDLWEVELRDGLDSDQRTVVKGSIVLNVGGPWGDDLTHRLTGGGQRRMVGLKGIHIIVNLPPELVDWGMMAINRENETLYCLPWNGMHYIGPTRTPFDGNLDSIVCTRREIDWMLAEINHVMPALNLKRDDVHYSYAGIQPVSSDPGDPKGTREVRIHDLGESGFPNMLMLTGGPIVTFRVVGSELADAVEKRIRPSNPRAEINWNPTELSQLIQTRNGNGDISALSAEIVGRITSEEQVVQLSDIFFQRSDLGWSRDQGRSDVERVAALVGETLGWDETQREDQVRTLLGFLDDKFPSYQQAKA